MKVGQSTKPGTPGSGPSGRGAVAGSGRGFMGRVPQGTRPPAENYLASRELGWPCNDMVRSGAARKGGGGFLSVGALLSLDWGHGVSAVEIGRRARTRESGGFVNRFSWVEQRRALLGSPLRGSSGRRAVPSDGGRSGVAVPRVRRARLRPPVAEATGSGRPRMPASTGAGSVLRGAAAARCTVFV